MIRDLKGTVEDKIPVETILVSVSDKSGLDKFVPALIHMNPDILVISTGGTYDFLKEVLGESFADNLLSVEAYTKFPPMEGGLVKTLDEKIYAGILGERNNPAHQQYLASVDGRFIDMVVVNLYPFEKTISAPGVTFEKARGNIDIGGPSMLRAAAKNFPGCATVCDPTMYERILEALSENDGCTKFEQRLRLARRVFDLTAGYDAAIAAHFYQQIGKSVADIKAEYTFRGE